MADTTKQVDVEKYPEITRTQYQDSCSSTSEETANSSDVLIKQARIDAQAVRVLEEGLSKTEEPITLDITSVYKQKLDGIIRYKPNTKRENYPLALSVARQIGYTGPMKGSFDWLSSIDPTLSFIDIQGRGKCISQYVLRSSYADEQTPRGTPVKFESFINGDEMAEIEARNRKSSFQEKQDRKEHREQARYSPKQTFQKQPNKSWKKIKSERDLAKYSTSCPISERAYQKNIEREKLKAEKVSKNLEKMKTRQEQDQCLIDEERREIEGQKEKIEGRKEKRRMVGDKRVEEGRIYKARPL